MCWLVYYITKRYRTNPCRCWCGAFEKIIKKLSSSEDCGVTRYGEDDVEHKSKNFPDNDLGEGGSSPTWSQLPTYRWLLLISYKKIKTRYEKRMLIKIYRDRATYNVFATNILVEQLELRLAPRTYSTQDIYIKNLGLRKAGNRPQALSFSEQNPVKNIGASISLLNRPNTTIPSHFPISTSPFSLFPWNNHKWKSVCEEVEEEARFPCRCPKTLCCRGCWGSGRGANFQLHFQLSAKISFGQRLFFAAGYVVSSFYHITTILFIIGIVNVIFARLFLIFWMKIVYTRWQWN